MASLGWKQLVEGDEKLGLKPTPSKNTHTRSLSLHDIEVMSSSSSDLFDLKSSSFDVSCASSCTTDDNWMSLTVAHTDDPSIGREVIGTHMDHLKALNDLQMVPFKWEEAPGKPLSTCSCNEVVTYNPSSLQLPPKLQCQSIESPHHSMQKSQDCHNDNPSIKRLTQPINQSLFSPSPKKQSLKKLCKSMLKTASCTGHAHHAHPSCNIEINPQSTSFDHTYKHHDELPFHDRLFFDRYISPKDLRYCASMDSILPTFDPSGREDEIVSRKALSFLAMEEHDDTESHITLASSPWNPMSFHEREGSPSPDYWQPSPTIKVHGKILQEDDDEAANDDDDVDDDEDEGFHDYFSTVSSIKPSQRTDSEAMESACSSPPPWYLDFSPEEEVHVERRGRKLIVRFMALIKLKGVISKIKRRREGANHHQIAESTMWSPTLATYLYNQQLEEEENQVIITPISSTISANYSAEDDGHSELGSNRLQIDPNYYLPSTIKTHYTNPNYSDEHNSTSEEKEEEEEELSHGFLRHRLSLGEQIAQFEDEDEDELLASPTPVGQPDAHFNPCPCKGMSKVRRTVHVLASTLKLVLVQTDIGKRKGAQRSFQICMKPTFSTHFSFHSHKK